MAIMVRRGSKFLDRMPRASTAIGPPIARSLEWAVRSGKPFRKRGTAEWQRPYIFPPSTLDDYLDAEYELKEK